MKLKKILAALTAAAAAVSAMTVVPVSAISSTTMIDFEDGDCSFVYMNVDDASSDESILSVERYGGSNQLKVDIQDKAKAAKVWFDLDKITDRSNTVQIRSIELDITFVPKESDKTVGWQGGTIGAAGGFDLNAAGKGQVNPSWSQASKQWEAGGYNPGEAVTIHVSRTYSTEKEQYTTEGINPFFGVMKYASTANDVIMYIDNIVLKDEAGKNLPISLGVDTPVAPEPEPETETAAEAVNVLDSETVIDTNWGTAAIVGADKLADVAEGTTIKVTLAIDTSADYNLVKVGSGASGWAKLECSTAAEGVDKNQDDGHAVVVADGTVTYTLTAADAETLKADGLAVSGYAITVKTVEVVAAAATPAPVEETTTAAAEEDETAEEAEDEDVDVDVDVEDEDEAEEEEAAPAVEETVTPVAVEETPAPAAETATAAPATGNTAVAAIVAVMAAAGAAALVSKKRK